MKLKTICFIVIPLIFFGCGAYHYIQRPSSSFESQKLPTNKAEMQQKIEEFHSKEAAKGNGRKR